MRGIILPTLSIGDIVKVTHMKDHKLFELIDIAIWMRAKKIKTILMKEIEQPYDYEKHKYIKKTYKIKYVLKDEDRVIIKSTTDAIPYQVIIHAGWKDESKIGHVFFNKMMNPAFIRSY